MKTLENSYCRPTTEAEWVKCIPWLNGDSMLSDISNTKFLAFGDGTISKDPKKGMTEIPVQHFIDLLEDRIVPWRLDEVGFKYIKDHTPFYEFSLSKVSNLSWAESTSKHGIALEIREEQIWFSIHNFTDLLTLIRFLK